MKMNKGMHHFQANNEDINKNPEVLFTLTVVEYLCPTNIYRESVVCQPSCWACGLWK